MSKDALENISDIEQIYQHFKNLAIFNDIYQLEHDLNELLENKQNDTKFFIDLNIYLLRRILRINHSILGHELAVYNDIKYDRLRDFQNHIEKGYCKIDHKDDSGKSPMELAIDKNASKIYEYLQNFYPDFSFKSIKLVEPAQLEKDIFRACTLGNLNSVRWFIEKKNIDKNIKDVRNDTPHCFNEWSTSDC